MLFFEGALCSADVSNIAFVGDLDVAKRKSQEASNLLKCNGGCILQGHRGILHARVSKRQAQPEAFKDSLEALASCHHSKVTLFCK